MNSDPSFKGKSEGSRRKSAIPKPTHKVAKQAAPRSYDAADEEATAGAGIKDSTPSFEQFVAGLRAFDDDDLEPGPGDNVSVEAGIPPPVLPAGDSRSDWISTNTPSFAAFLAEVAGEEEETSGTTVQQPPVVLDLTLGDKVQAAPAEEFQQSKNEKRHHQKRRRRQTSNATGSFEVTLPVPVAAAEKKSSVFYDALQIQSQTISLNALTKRTVGTPSSSTIPEPLTLEGFKPTESEEKLLPWGFLPVNLRRISEKELESFFLSIGPHDPRIIVDPQVQMFQSQGEGNLVGDISIRNQSPYTIAFRIRASAARKYTVSPIVGEVPIGGETKVYVETLKNLRLTIDEIQGDRFVVDIMQLTSAFCRATAGPGLVWQSGVAGQWRIPVEVVGGFWSDPGIAVRRRCENKASSAFDRGLMRAVASSDEIFQLRCLEEQIGQRVDWKGLENQLQRVNPTPSASPQEDAGVVTTGYSDMFLCVLFAAMLFGIMTFILFF